MNLLLADVVWPALFLLDRMLALPVVIIGLGMEAALFRYFFRITWRRALATACVVNLASSFVGLLVLPAWGWYWEYSVTARNRLYGWGTFNVMTWSETCLMAWLLTSVVEFIPLRVMMGRQKHLLPCLLLANVLSVGLAYLSLSCLSTRYDPWDVYNSWAGNFLPALY